jgi:hypothetical protein
MDNIPSRSHLIVSTLSRVMITETVQQTIPKRIESLNEKAFTKRNPDIINHQVAAPKIFESKIFGILNGFCVFPQPSPKHIPRVCTEPISAFA